MRKGEHAHIHEAEEKVVGPPGIERGLERGEGWSVRARRLGEELERGDLLELGGDPGGRHERPIQPLDHDGRAPGVEDAASELENAREPAVAMPDELSNPHSRKTRGAHVVGNLNTA